MRVISAEEQKKVIEMADMIEAVSTALCEYSDLARRLRCVRLFQFPAIVEML